jgi:hypothetical protein
MLLDAVQSSTSGVLLTQWRAVSTRFGAMSVPEHRPTPPMSMPTTQSSVVSEVPPMMGACALPVDSAFCVRLLHAAPAPSKVTREAKIADTAKREGMRREV